MLLKILDKFFDSPLVLSDLNLQLDFIFVVIETSDAGSKWVMLVARCSLVSKLFDLVGYIHMVMTGPGQTILLHRVPIQVLETLQLAGLLCTLGGFI